MEFNSRELSKLSDQIYSGYGFSGKVGLRYFSSFLEQLSRFEKKDIIVHQIIEYPMQYVFDFLLSAPFIWTEMSGEDWIEIMRKINPRCDPAKRVSWDKCFSDIHFLCKYIGVNALDRFLAENSFGLLDKKYVLKYSLRRASLFFMDEIDAEDLDGEYFVEIETINKAREKLISCGEFRRLEMSESEFLEYVISQGRSYGIEF